MTQCSDGKNCIFMDSTVDQTCLYP